MNAIRRAIDVVGGRRALALACGVSFQAVSKWVARGQVPAMRVLAVEAATRGLVGRSELRPDIYPSDVFFSRVVTGAMGGACDVAIEVEVSS